MASYQQLPSGKWRAQYYVDGQRRSITRATKRECQKAVEQHELIRNGFMTVGQAVEEHIALHSNTLSPSTINGYRKIQRNYFLGLQKVHLDDLDERKINEAVNAEAALRSPKTVRNAYGLIRTAISPYLPINAWKIHLPQKAKKEIKIPTEQEVKTLLVSAQDSEMLTPLQLAAFCGLRRSEICALTYADVQDGYVTVNKAVVKGADGAYHTKTPKSYAGYRRVKLPSNIHIGCGALDERITRFNPDNLSNYCLRLSGGKISMHTLRHYYASVLLKLGVPNKYAAKQMGHSGEEMLQKVYQHLFASTEAEYDARIAEAVSGE